MSYKFDYFVAHLTCPNCGAVSPADQSTNMVTAIRDEPELAWLGVGDALHVRPEAMNDRGYLTIRAPRTGEPIRILQTWECPSCGQGFNWAEVVVRDDVIESIQAVPLTRETLERAHFIDDEAIGVAAVLIGQSYADLVNEDVVQILKDRLP
jgi:rubredoxin